MISLYTLVVDGITVVEEKCRRDRWVTFPTGFVDHAEAALSASLDAASPRPATVHWSGGAVSDFWWERAACRGEDTNLFFPSSGTTRSQVQKIQEICGGCPVRQQCAQEAIDDPDGSGSGAATRLPRTRSTWG